MEKQKQSETEGQPVVFFHYGGKLRKEKMREKSDVAAGAQQREMKGSGEERRVKRGGLQRQKKKADGETGGDGDARG